MSDFGRGPIDFTSLQVRADPLGGFAQGYAQTAQIQQIAAQQRAAQAAAAQAQEEEDYFEGLFSNPSLQGYQEAIARYPKRYEATKAAYDALSTEQKNAEFSRGLRVHTALQNKKYEIALQEARATEEAYRNSGDEENAQEWAGIREAIEDNPEYADAQLGDILHSVDPDKYTKYTEERRTQSTAGATVRKAEADANKAESEAVKSGVEAQYADPNAQVDLKKKNADAIRAEVELKYAERKAVADLGLTEAQQSQALANVRKLNAETRKALADAASGPFDAEKRFDAESKLRKEYAANTQNYQVVKEANERIKVAEDSGAGDIALVYSYMKILDPTSVVREGEFATAENSSGIPEKVRGIYNKAMTGQRLTSGQRIGFTSQAKSLVKAAEIREKEVRDSIATVAGSYKLDLNNVLPPAQRADEAQPPDGKTIVDVDGPAAAQKLPPGTLFRTPDGVTRRKR